MEVVREVVRAGRKSALTITQRRLGLPSRQVEEVVGLLPSGRDPYQPVDSCVSLRRIGRA